VKRLLYLVLAVVLVLIAALIYWRRVDLGLVSGPSNGVGNDAAASASNGASGSQTSPAALPVQIVWQSVDHSAEGFKVEMPAGIKQIQVPARNEQDGVEQVAMIYAYPNADTCFSVAWADNPPVERVNREVPERTLVMARDNAMERTQTTLVNESEISQQGFPARDFSARNQGGGVFSSRLVLARKRLYMLTAAFPSASARRDEDVTRFFNSFNVVAASRNQ
jgi:hypothetical protein